MLIFHLNFNTKKIAIKEKKRYNKNNVNINKVDRAIKEEDRMKKNLMVFLVGIILGGTAICYLTARRRKRKWITVRREEDEEEIEEMFCEDLDEPTKCREPLKFDETAFLSEQR